MDADRPTAAARSGSYVLVLSLAPLRVYLCKEGLVRFCSTAYTPLEQDGASQALDKHLTNFGLQKFSPAFDRSVLVPPRKCCDAPRSAQASANKSVLLKQRAILIIVLPPRSQR